MSQSSSIEVFINDKDSYFWTYSESLPKSITYFIYSVINLVKFHILSEDCEIFSSAGVHV